MTDYIKRTDAIKLARIYDSSDFCVMAVTVKEIRNIPSADVAEVVRGKWVNYGDEYRPDIKCCVCGQRKPILLGNFNFNFCPNCGADMREES